MTGDSELLALVRAIVSGDSAGAARLLAESPTLATARFDEGATHQVAQQYFIDTIARYIYRGDTALHVAAAAYRTDFVQELLASGADVRAKNRRGAEPLHAAVAGVPGSRGWNPGAQSATVACLVAAGADPEATNIYNMDNMDNMVLANETTGRGGSGGASEPMRTAPFWQ